MAKVAPKIIDKNAVPQKITMKEPAKGDNEKPSRGTNALKFALKIQEQLVLEKE